MTKNILRVFSQKKRIGLLATIAVVCIGVTVGMAVASVEAIVLKAKKPIGKTETCEVYQQGSFITGMNVPFIRPSDLETNINLQSITGENRFVNLREYLVETAVSENGLKQNIPYCILISEYDYSGKFAEYISPENFLEFSGIASGNHGDLQSAKGPHSSSWFLAERDKRDLIFSSHRTRALSFTCYDNSKYVTLTEMLSIVGVANIEVNHVKF
jgi:hypothetical protein